MLPPDLKRDRSVSSQKEPLCENADIDAISTMQKGARIFDVMVCKSKVCVIRVLFE